MRIIRVDEDSEGRTILWVAAGATIGLLVGALIAERMSGRKVSARMLWRRARGLSGIAAKRWTTLLAAAGALRDAWEARDDDEPAAGGIDDFDELDDIEDGPADSGVADALDVVADDVGDDDDDAGDDVVTSGTSWDPDEDALDARVLEAFANDPVLAERAVEIEEADDGRIVLHGRVHSAREVAHAVTVARGVPGVTAVKQKLAVRDRR